jgi:hypothetical protein
MCQLHRTWQPARHQLRMPVDAPLCVVKMVADSRVRPLEWPAVVGYTHVLLPIAGCQPRAVALLPLMLPLRETMCAANSCSSQQGVPCAEQLTLV